MKALLSIEPGGPETLTLREVSMPQPGPGELRVRVRTCSINYPDVLVIEDKYQFKPQRPFAPGVEISGIVDAVGEGVTGWTAGMHLISTLSSGGLADYAVVNAGDAFPIPDGQDPVEGAALILTYATALHALADRGQLRKGETLLVLGAAGGVGLAAIEIGKVMGARVIAAVSSEDKTRIARAVGADELMIYGEGPFDREQARALAGRFKQAVGPQGADVIYDPVGGDYAEPALRSIAWEGRYLVIGFPAGIPSLPLNLPLLKSCDIRGIFWGGFAQRDPEGNRRNTRQLIDWWVEGRIRPRIDKVYPLARGGEAIARLASRSAIGKVVVTIGA
ncbi:NADPH:quinone oxidoreductase family protein [Niveispirillum sp.]|uniref:NADPH:quinone oxidoreductase family protein n=1 Tax=Niveispirillum sp. TaxID=1917217 RepID=UPI001B50E269|nr:NADPH:quinone oxidoreductase family protein [Niveispirillum sp.]MBP7335279.1 NADPH:quinone oxidoreductase family protein [Niveispirillum sp.]